MRVLNAFLLIGTLTMVCTSAAAQHLTRNQAGRVAVAPCYAHCTELAYSQIVTSARLALDGAGGEWNRNDFLLVACQLVQTDAKAADMCRAGCLDIEAAYGWRSSHIRTRFSYLYNSFVRDVRTAGLWNQWNNFPEPGTDRFARACARYAQILQTRSSQIKKIVEQTEPWSPEVLHDKRLQVMEAEVVPEPPRYDDSDFWDDSD